MESLDRFGSPPMSEKHSTVIAGIPMVHRAEAGIQVMHDLSPTWTPSAVTDTPLEIVHTVGETDPGDMELVVEASPPFGRYYRDSRGQLAIRSTDRDGQSRPQLMRTISPGTAYSLTYAAAADSLAMQWGWQRTIFMFALAARQRGLMAHGCGFLLSEGRGILCPGVSGAGKSTLAGLLKTGAADRVAILSDDRLAITEEASGFAIWGTPWYSSARVSSSGNGPLRALVMIRHGGEPVLSRVSPGEAARCLMRTLAFPFWDAAGMEHSLSFVDRLVGSVPAYELSYSAAHNAGGVLVDLLEAIPSLDCGHANV